MLLVTPQSPAVQQTAPAALHPSVTPSGATSTHKKPYQVPKKSLTSPRQVLLLPYKRCLFKPTAPAPNPTLTSPPSRPLPSQQAENALQMLHKQPLLCQYELSTYLVSVLLHQHCTALHCMSTPHTQPPQEL
jgi:hypothetical protein